MAKTTLKRQLLAFFLLISIGSIAQLSKIDKWHFESFGNYKENNEIISLRNQYTKHFKNDDGTTTALIAAGSLHYFDDGQWKTIFHAIDKTNQGFENTDNRFSTFFPLSSTGNIRTVLEDGSEFFDLLEMKMYYLEGSQKLHQQAISNSQGNANGNVLIYPNIYGEDIDLRLTQNTDVRKMDYVLSSASSLHPNTMNYDYVVFEEKVQLPNGWIAQLNGSEILIVDQSGILHLKFEKPALKDADIHNHLHNMDTTINHSSCHHSEEIDALALYEIHQSGNILTVLTKIPTDWLLSPNRNFPLYIDPTVNCNPNNTANWTGYHRTTSGNSNYSDGSANYTSTNITSSVQDFMRLGRTNTDEVYNNWIKFNISGVPDNACITSANINYSINYNYSNDPPNCIINMRMRHMSTDPSIAFSAGNNTARLADIRNGDIYHQQNLAAGATGTGWRSVVLGSFLSNLTSQLPADWFAVGLNSYAGGPHTSCYLDLNGHSHASKPYLAVTYKSPTINAGADQSICLGQQIALSGSVTPTTPVATTLFSENFESYGNVSPLPSTGAGWRSVELSSSTPWFWQIENSCAPAGGSRCLNMNDSYGNDCDYSWNDGGMKVAWHGTLIDASMHNSLKLNFKWKGFGEIGFDWGHIVYSLDGLNWMDLTTTQYGGQTAWQTVSNLDISMLDGQQFYLGFKWLNDNATGAIPGFSIDDVSITATPLAVTYSWSGGPIVSGGTTLTPVVNPTTSTTYTLTATMGACSFTDQVVINLPTMGTTLAQNNETATCLVSGTNWIHFFHNSGRYIGAINPQGNNLGNVQMTAYVDGTNLNVQACGLPSIPINATTVMQRHWVAIPTVQPSSAVQVGLPFTNTELTTLSTLSNANMNPNDNVAGIGSLMLSKYHGPANVNNIASDNCPGAGGNGNTSLHNQASNGNLNTVLAGFVNTSYSRHSIPSFSEFWLHGSSNNSALPTTFESLKVTCKNGSAQIQWSTTSENNSSHFELERSFDGNTFELLATVLAAGNSNETIVYYFEDNDARNISYYRIRQIDLDGQFESFGPVSADCNEDFIFDVYPNPAEDKLSILVGGLSPSGQYSFKVSDLEGKLVEELAASFGNEGLIYLNIRELANGLYIISLFEGDLPIAIKRFVKK